MPQLEIHGAKGKRSQLVERATFAEEIVIARKGNPAARLIPVRASAAPAMVRGAWRGQVGIAVDFDELPHDVAETFGATG